MKTICIDGLRVVDYSGECLTEEELDALRAFILCQRASIKSAKCSTCDHYLCVNCKDEKWSMIEILGFRCCQCQTKASLEVWRSGARIGEKHDVDTRNSQPVRIYTSDTKLPSR